jgi:hypothetical protein
MTVFTAYDNNQIIDYLKSQVHDGEVTTDTKNIKSSVI